MYIHCLSSKQHGRAPPVNQVSNKARAPCQSSKQHGHAQKSPSNFIAWGSLLLPAPTAGPPSPLIPRQHRYTPLHPPGACGLGVRPLASLWTFGDHPGRHTEVRIKHDFTSVPESSWLWRKLHQKVQLFQREGGGMVYWPACWVAYKRKSWAAWSSVCSQ